MHNSSRLSLRSMGRVLQTATSVAGAFPEPTTSHQTRSMRKAATLHDQSKWIHLANLDNATVCSSQFLRVDDVEPRAFVSSTTSLSFVELKETAQLSGHCWHCLPLRVRPTIVFGAVGTGGIMLGRHFKLNEVRPFDEATRLRKANPRRRTSKDGAGRSSPKKRSHT